MKKIIIAMGFLGLFAGSATSVLAGYFNTTPVNSCDTQITRTLQVGSKNNDVYVLQNMLSASGYLFVAPNGYFGPSTKAAVKRFQNANGVPATGTVGASTRNAINERLCDTDLLGGNSSYDSYGYSSGITYVDNYDPYVIVVSPKVTTPVIYATPQENTASLFPKNVTSNTVINASGYIPIDGNYQVSNSIVPATTQIQGTNIVYNPSMGYTYGVIPKSGSITVTSPIINSVYKEGDTVNLVWTTDNINATQFQVYLENTSTKQSKLVTMTRNKSISFVLSKEILDAVCAGACDNNQQGTFKIVIATPVTDIAGITSMFRAGVSPITIRRPYAVSAAVTITTNKTPVNSGEAFRLYVNTPSVNSWDANLRENTIVKIHAICINNVQVSIAGVPCGQDFSMPLSALASQSGIPTMITNTTWYKQDVVFEVVLTNVAGLVIGTAKTTVVANNAPFNW